MIVLEEKFIKEYIFDTINDIKIQCKNVDETYHHNSEYKDAPKICQYGILSLNELNKQGIKKYSKEFLSTMSDIESHVNGSDAISLSRVGLKDLYQNEEIYDPFSPNLVDFIVSNDVKAQRTSIHYGNEFIVQNEIEISKLVALDIRLLKLLEHLKLNSGFSNITLREIIEKFNYLKDIAIAMKQSKLDMPLRERSYETLSLDVDKLSNIEKIKIK